VHAYDAAPGGAFSTALRATDHRLFSKHRWVVQAVGGSGKSDDRVAIHLKAY
jgi:hypothetical protein